MPTRKQSSPPCSPARSKRSFNSVSEIYCKISKKHFAISIIILLWFFLFWNVLTVNASNFTYSTDSIDSDSKTEYLQTMNLQLLTDEPVISSIQCISANDNGMIAVVSCDCEIIVYSFDGQFLYGYSFERNGAYGIQWEKNYIQICDVRSDTVATFDSLGKNIDVQYIIQSDDYSSNWLRVQNNRYCMIDNIEFQIIDDGVTEKLIKKDVDNHTSIICQSTTSPSHGFITFIIILFFIQAVAGIGILLFFKARKRQNEYQ